MAPFQYLKRLNEIDLGVKMGGFKERGFETTTYIEESIEEKKLVLIACEGAVTEYQYFNVIKDKLTLKQLGQQLKQLSKSSSHLKVTNHPILKL
jgi:tRNA 2-selenouridine synthase SelU